MPFAAARQVKDKIRRLIFGRLIVSGLMFALTWLWTGGHWGPEGVNLATALLPPFVALIALSIVYLTALRLNENFGVQVRLQFLFDFALITWMVWRTGDVTSPYLSLFIVLVTTSSFFVRPKETILLSTVCALALASLTGLAAGGFVPSSNSNFEFSKAIQIVGFNVVAFLVVGMLASRLAERRSSGELLEEAARSLASLRAVHERIVESIRSGLITTDLDGTIFTFNHAAADITGFKAKEMIGHPISELFGNFNSALDNIEHVGSGEHSLRFETDLVNPEGFTLKIGYNISPLFSEEGAKTGLIVTFQDLTEIRIMEESARRKDRLAAVGRVAAGLAHEIRNPLGAMRGSIQVLRSGLPPESAQSGLMDIVIRESDRLNNIITNFLLYARPRVSNYSEMDVREAIEDTIALLEHSPDKKPSHTLEVSVPGIPVKLFADPTQIKQIFWNLARNAIQAMPDGGKFRIEASPVDAERTRIVFSDTGVGMSPEQVEKLFEPFSESTTGGTGLGLSIVYQIVRDHSGVINIRSREGEGTTITVELPSGKKAGAFPIDFGIDDDEDILGLHS